MTEPPGGLHHVDIVALASFLGSGALVTVAAAFGKAWPAHADQAVFYAAAASALCGCIVRVLGNPTGRSATSIVEGAPIVSPPPNPEVTK